jgi:N-sulfoglucosamine sulfohydrolase
MKANRYFFKAVTAVHFVLNVSCDHEVPPQTNILLIIADDQSYPHFSTYGDSTLNTPAFDRLANEGILFTNCFCPASQCSPSRASLLTGRNIWQLEEAGSQGSIFPAKFEVYTEILEANGYHVGFTGKPWAPGSWKDGGRKRNPAGFPYNEKTLIPPTSEISDCDYAGNFRDFLTARPDNAPFCFWLGCHEPHRDYEENSALKFGKNTDDIDPPGYLPDDDVIRNDLLDYKLEIEWFDKQIEKTIKILEESGELDNTLIVVTSDNGMPFPRAKANLYDPGTRIPLAMQWKARIKGGRVVNDLISLIDFAPTFLEIAGVEVNPEMTGVSLMKILNSDASGTIDESKEFVVMGKERHNHARPDHVGYPVRAIRTAEFLYIMNLKNDRWPLGDPPLYCCHTIMTNPSKDLILENKDEYITYFDLIYNKRPEEELFDIVNDPDCIINLASKPEYSKIATQLRSKLEQILTEQGDPRLLGYGDIFESYPYYQKFNDIIPGFKERGKYNPKYMIEKK